MDIDTKLDTLEYGIEDNLTITNFINCLLNAVEESTASYFNEDKLTLELKVSKSASANNKVVDGFLFVEWEVPKKFQHIERDGIKGRIDSIRLQLSVVAYYYHRGMFSSIPLVTPTSVKGIEIYYTLLEDDSEDIKGHYHDWDKGLKSTIVEHAYSYLVDEDVVRTITKIIRKYNADKSVYVPCYRTNLML